MNCAELGEILKLQDGWMRARSCLHHLRPALKECPEDTLAFLANHVAELDPQSIKKGRPSAQDAVSDLEHLIQVAELFGGKKATLNGLRKLADAFAAFGVASLSSVATETAAAINTQKAQAQWKQLEKERKAAESAARVQRLAEWFRDTRRLRGRFQPLKNEMTSMRFTAAEWRAVSKAVVGRAGSTKKEAEAHLERYIVGDRNVARDQSHAHAYGA